jgi:iron complex outermembrane receptor protein
LTEPSSRGADAGNTWVPGGAFHFERYDGEDVEGFDCTCTIPSLFAQDEYAVAGWLTLAASGRVDWHGGYGARMHGKHRTRQI